VPASAYTVAPIRVRRSGSGSAARRASRVQSQRSPAARTPAGLPSASATGTASSRERGGPSRASSRLARGGRAGVSRGSLANACSRAPRNHACSATSAPSGKRAVAAVIRPGASASASQASSGWGSRRSSNAWRFSAGAPGARTTRRAAPVRSTRRCSVTVWSSRSPSCWAVASSSAPVRAVSSRSSALVASVAPRVVRTAPAAAASRAARARRLTRGSSTHHQGGGAAGAWPGGRFIGAADVRCGKRSRGPGAGLDPGAGN
jgi:hypothetical protein